jgi:hypothetical protein
MFKILLKFSKKIHIEIALKNKNFQKNPIFFMGNWQILLKKITTSIEKFEAIKPMKVMTNVGQFSNFFENYRV